MDEEWYQTTIIDPITTFTSGFNIILNSKDKYITLKVAMYPDIEAAQSYLSPDSRIEKTDALWSLLEPIYPNTLIKGDYAYLHSILDTLSNNIVWNKLLNLKELKKKFTNIISTIENQRDLVSLAKTYFGSD